MLFVCFIYHIYFIFLDVFAANWEKWWIKGLKHRRDLCDMRKNIFCAMCFIPGGIVYPHLRIVGSRCAKINLQAETFISSPSCWPSVTFSSAIFLITIFNPLCAKFFRGNININLHFMSFLHTNKTQVVEIPSSSNTRTCLFYIINIMAADVLAT